MKIIHLLSGIFAVVAFGALNALGDHSMGTMEDFRALMAPKHQTLTLDVQVDAFQDTPECRSKWSIIPVEAKATGLQAQLGDQEFDLSLYVQVSEAGGESNVQNFGRNFSPSIPLAKMGQPLDLRTENMQIRVPIDPEENSFLLLGLKEGQFDTLYLKSFRLPELLENLENQGTIRHEFNQCLAGHFTIGIE